MIERHKPDILSCIANLSSDEVFTPPKVANAVLDLLPRELFENPKTTFLDPCCKSGVFLREIAKRLLVGLEKKIPDARKRIDHIFHNQLFGLALTELTGLMSRRSVYCSKNADGEYSVSLFKNGQGHICYNRFEHDFQNGKCRRCGASQSEYDRGETLETHAYSFIHADKVFNGMQFDVIIGNPPYQLDTDGAGKQARPIYHFFIEQAKKLNPRYLTMIIPSRWFSGGMGLDEFRKEMLSDSHIKRIVDYSLSTECFPGVDIAGGVCYFLWEREYNGECKYTYFDNGTKTTVVRKLNEFEIFVRNNSAVKIIRKIQEKRETSIGNIMSSLGPFGLGTAERGQEQQTQDSYILLSSAGRSFIRKNLVRTGYKYINKWKVIIGKATSAGAATANKDGQRKVIATLDILEPNAVCTFSYFIGGAFSSKQEAINCKTYLATKFSRFLLLQTLSSINITKDRFQFVPVQDFSKPWTDAELYEKYGLSDEETAFIESMIRPME